MEGEKKFECNIHVLVKEKDSEVDNYFGHGVAKLLYGIKEYHSLRVSAKQMRMAYSKAWRIIREAEEGLGIQLLSRMGKKKRLSGRQKKWHSESFGNIIWKKKRIKRY